MKIAHKKFTLLIATSALLLGSGYVALFIHINNVLKSYDYYIYSFNWNLNASGGLSSTGDFDNPKNAKLMTPLAKNLGCNHQTTVFPKKIYPIPSFSPFSTDHHASYIGKSGTGYLISEANQLFKEIYIAKWGLTFRVPDNDFRAWLTNRNKDCAASLYEKI